jgi:hypothetical protein
MGYFFSGPGQQQPTQLFFDLLVFKRLCPFLGHNDQVGGGHFSVVAAEKFPEQAFHPIPLHRLPQALGHNQPQPGASRGRGRQGHTEMARV